MTDTMTEEPTTEETPPDDEPMEAMDAPEQFAATPCAAPCRVSHCIPSSSGATAGIPGTWTPSGSAVPILADIQSGHHPITASPNTAWTTGQYVQTATPGAGGRIHWSGTAWVVGPA